MNAILNELCDLVDVLNLEPRYTELSIEFFDRAVVEAHQTGLISDEECDLFAAYLNGVAA
jgi:hypothetical protein